MLSKNSWAQLSTFVPNKSEPVYNWLYYKEGFSKELVFRTIGMLGLGRGSMVLDSFCGVGTTLLACKQHGINSTGIDVLPAALLASRAKTQDYDIDELKKEAKSLLKEKFIKIRADYPKLMKRAFSSYALDDILFFRERIDRLNNREFFLLALVNAAINISYTWKDGSVLKFRKRSVAPLRVMLRRKIYNMIKDLYGFKSEKCGITVNQGDARRMALEDESVDAIITSPPYLNQIDYTKVYAIENFIAAGKTAPLLRSFISDKEYFKDMQLAIEEMFRVCRKGASVAMVIGNAPGKESDVLLAGIAEKAGFALDKIYVLNQRFSLKNRTQQTGKLRESMIVLRK